MKKDEIDYIKIIENLQDVCVAQHYQLHRLELINKIYQTALEELQDDDPFVEEMIRIVKEKINDLPDMKITKIDKDGDLG